MGVVESAKGKSENGIHPGVSYPRDTSGGMTARITSRQTRFQGYLASFSERNGFDREI
jgi:hypothetical protein